MRCYSAAKVKGDFYGLGSLLEKPLIEVKARNYNEAVEKAIHSLCLKKGDTLSMIALQGNLPKVKGFGLPGRYEYKV